MYYNSFLLQVNYLLYHSIYYADFRFLLDESPLGCQRPCMTISYQLAKHEFPGFNYSYVWDKVSILYMSIESTDIEIREDYILVPFLVNVAS